MTLDYVLVVAKRNVGARVNMNHKKVKNESDAWNMQETYVDKPHGWIQWKGTGVCMDISCVCGYHSHIDAEFAYHVECPKCHRIYMCNGYIELIELEERPKNCVVTPELNIESEIDLLLDKVQ